MKVFKIVVRSICCVLALLLIIFGINIIRNEILGIKVGFLFTSNKADFYSEYVFKKSISDIILTSGFIGFCLYYIIESIFILFPSLKASKTEKANKKRAKLQKKLDKLNTESGE